MIEVLSRGSQLRRGKYVLHSRFRSAVNFHSEHAFAFVVNPEIGSGPLNIVLQGIGMDSLKSLEVESNCLYVNGEKFVRHETQCYDSAIEASTCDRNLFLYNLRLFEKHLLLLSHPKSLVFLLDGKRKAVFTSSFETEYAKRCESGLGKILSGDLANGISIMKGLGPGLTPSGDDFNSGLLIALNLLQILHLDDYSQIIELVHRAAKGSNPFTNAFLQCAAMGQVGEKFKWLIESLLQGGEDEIISNLTLVLNTGETSGADQAVGFLVGLRKFLQ
jgi:hypothetical protein